MVSAGRVIDRVVKGGVGPPDEDIPLTVFMNGINSACFLNADLNTYAIGAL